MAWLCLDTHISGKTRLGLLGHSGWIEYREEEGRAHRVLTIIAAWHKQDPKLIQGVAVVEGPGSFSAIRTGVLYADLYARLRHLPLVALGPDHLADPVALFEKIQDGTLSRTTYVAPVYDQEPNITVPRA